MLQQRVQVTDGVEAQLEDILGFDVADFVPRGASSIMAAASIPLSDQLATLAYATQEIAGYAITDEQCKERLEELSQAFNRGFTKARDHTLDHYDAMLVSENSGWIAKLLNIGVEEWSSALLRVGMDAG